MSEWLSWQELLELLSIKEFEVLKYLAKGLQPYSRYGLEPINCPNLCHAYHIGLPHLMEKGKIVSWFEEILKRLKKEMKGKSSIRLEDSDSIVDYLYRVAGYSFQPQASKDGEKVIISREDVKKLSAFGSKLEEERSAMEEEIRSILADDPDCVSWKYFIVPSSDTSPTPEEDIKKLISEHLENAIFKRDEVLEVQEKYGLGSMGELEKQTPKADYVFRQEGPSWVITYEGKTLRGLKNKGFEIIHYLICNKSKVYYTDELAREFDKLPPVDTKQAVETYSDDERNEQGIDSRDIVYGKAKDELKKHYYDLQQEVRKAEESGEPSHIEKAKAELQEFCKHAPFAKDGKSRKFVDEATRAKDRIYKRIKRALNKIKEYDQDTYLHFHKSLDYSTSKSLHSYNPDRPIDWHT